MYVFNVCLYLTVLFRKWMVFRAVYTGFNVLLTFRLMNLVYTDRTENWIDLLNLIFLFCP